MYENVRLKVVDNGFKLCYTEKSKPNSNDKFANCRYDDRELVYKDEEVDKATQKLLELAKMSRKKSPAPSMMETEEEYD